MDDLFAFGGPAPDATPQAPYCAAPMQTRPYPAWGYRWLNAPVPVQYRVLEELQFRVPGAGTYEVQLSERVVHFATGDGLPAGVPPGLVEGVSGLIRMRVFGGGDNAGRLTSGRATAVTTGSDLRVQVLVPVDAVDIASQPVPGGGNTTNVVVADGRVRIVGVPARSRVPSEWRVSDWIQPIADPPPGTLINQVPIYPGASDVRVSGLTSNAITVNLRTSPIVATPFTALLSPPSTLEFGWIPVDGATSIFLEAVGGPGIYNVIQRGFL